MLKLFIIFIAFLGANAHASAICDQRASAAASMVPTKHSVREELRTKPVSGPGGEVWRYLAYLHADEYQQLGDSHEQIGRTAKLIAENDISNDWRIETLVYSEFFRAICVAKLNVLDIRSLDAEALGGCFGKAPPGAKNFPDCVRAQVSKISESAQAR